MKFFIIIFITFFSIKHSVSQKKINLELNLKIGDKYIYEYRSLSETKQEIMGENQSINKNDFLKYSFYVKGKPSDTTYYIEFAYKKINYKIKIQNNVDIFDTDSTENKTSFETELLSSFINRNVYLTINKKGKILKINKLDFYSVEDSLNKTDKLSNEYFSKSALSELLFPVKFPYTKINLQEKWTNNDTVTINILDIYNTSYICTAIDKNSSYINKSSKISTKKDKTLILNNIFFNYDMKGTSTGNDIINNVSGIIQKSVKVQNVKGIVSIKYSKDSEPAYSWPITIKKTISLKTHKTEK